MSLNNIIRNNLYLMEELATMPFTIAQELWSGSTDGDDTTLSSTVNRSLNIMQSIVSTPFEIALDFFESDQKQNQKAAGETSAQSENNMGNSQYNAQNQEHHFPPNAEH